MLFRSRVGVTKGHFTLDSLADSDTALTLRPSVNGKDRYNLGKYKPQYPSGRNNIAPNNQYGGEVLIVEAKCRDNNGDYVCFTLFIGE